MHACDARVKVLLLVVYTVAVFWVETWAGMGLLLALFCAIVALSRVRFSRVLGMGVPVYVLAIATVVFAACNPQTGFELGCFYGIRMILLVLASLIVVFTTTSTRLTEALCSFLSPLRVLHVPVDDIAMVLNLALRFIPLTAQELCLVRDAQYSRGAPFEVGGVAKRLFAWTSVFIPLFVNLFRRADKLSVAMDARCYGAPGMRRTALSQSHITWQSALAFVVGAAGLALIAIYF